MGIAILNKTSGLYGLLPLLTGQPLSFEQWLFNILALVTLPVYILAVMNVSRQSQAARKIALASLVYLGDSLIGLLYTLIFASEWFGGEALQGPPSPEISSSGKLASSARETAVTVMTILGLLTLRVYTTALMVAFCFQLLKKQREDHLHDQPIPANLSELVRISYALEIKARDLWIRWLL